MVGIALTGWNFWLAADDRFRNLLVAENDRTAAGTLAETLAPNMVIVHANVLPSSVMIFLNAKRGETFEGFCSDKPLEPLHPNTVR